MTKNWIVSIATLACLACGSNNNSNNTSGKYCSVRQSGDVMMGGVFAYTGDWPIGGAMERAVLTAIHDVNAGGGLDGKGKTLGLRTCDDAGDPNRSAAALQELVADKITTVVGPNQSLTTLADIPVADAGNVLLMTPSATSAQIAASNDKGYIFASVTNTASQSTSQAKYLYDSNIRNLSILYVNGDAWALNFAQHVQTAFTALGGNANSYMYNTADANYATAALQAANAFNADGIYLISYVSDGAPIVKAAQTYAWTTHIPAFAFGDGVVTSDFSAAVGNNAFMKGLGGITEAQPQGTNFNSFAADYNTLFGIAQPELYTPNAYDAAYIYAIALSQATNPQDGSAVLAKIPVTQQGTSVPPGNWANILGTLKSAGTLSYQGASGPMHFNTDGSVQGLFQYWSFDTNGQVVYSPTCYDGTGAPVSC